ncbi:RNA binding [Striga asiatica]|uniref:RNA binding n=1 Tax=Striga asiatica TaxID=4170 RepID=A0A5A7P462_STRAF|nr:RNA binding [Striga asiatica]
MRPIKTLTTLVRPLAILFPKRSRHLFRIIIVIPIQIPRHKIPRQVTPRLLRPIVPLPLSRLITPHHIRPQNLQLPPKPLHNPLVKLHIPTTPNIEQQEREDSFMEIVSVMESVMEHLVRDSVWRD